MSFSCLLNRTFVNGICVFYYKQIVFWSSIGMPSAELPMYTWLHEEQLRKVCPGKGLLNAIIHLINCENYLRF